MEGNHGNTHNITGYRITLIEENKFKNKKKRISCNYKTVELKYIKKK